MLVKEPMVAMVIAFPCFRTAPTAASMAVEETGDDRTAPRRGRNAKEDGRKRLSWIARNGAQRQGKKVAHGRCGITIEAKPLSGQTCQIEPASGPVIPEGKATHGCSPIGHHQRGASFAGHTHDPS